MEYFLSVLPNSGAKIMAIANYEEYFRKSGKSLISGKAGLSRFSTNNVFHSPIIIAGD